MISSIKELLIASGNKGKVLEIAQLLQPLNINAISAAQFDLEEPEENGKNFEENSQIKAKYYGKKTNLVALSDDSGLCIEALEGEPGIASARFAIDENGEKNFPKAFEKIVTQLKEKNFNFDEKIRAHFICNLTLFDPRSDFVISFEGRVDGNLIFPARGNKGFGYDPIFIKDGMNQTFGEIDPIEKDLISHRGLAFKKFVTWLEKVNLKD